MKRGPKPFNENSDKLMPVADIAKRVGVSIRTVNYDIQRALNKMRFSFLLWRAYYGVAEEVR
jgi:DNA-binding Lrp family transcriptional regulator